MLIFKKCCSEIQISSKTPNNHFHLSRFIPFLTLHSLLPSLSFWNTYVIFPPLLKRSRHCFKETFNNFDEMKPENSLNAPKGLASTQEASYDGRRSPWKQKNKDKPIWLENRATHYLGSAASKEVNHHLSLISKISHSNSTKLGKFLWNTQKKIGAVNFHSLAKNCVSLIISDENSGLGLVFPWLAELPPPAFSEPGGGPFGLPWSYQPSEGWDPWQDVLQCRLSSWPGLHPQGWEALANQQIKCWRCHWWFRNPIPNHLGCTKPL